MLRVCQYSVNQTTLIYEGSVNSVLSVSVENEKRAIVFLAPMYIPVVINDVLLMYGYALISELVSVATHVVVFV